MLLLISCNDKTDPSPTPAGTVSYDAPDSGFAWNCSDDTDCNASGDSACDTTQCFSFVPADPGTLTGKGCLANNGVTCSCVNHACDTHVEAPETVVCTLVGCSSRVLIYVIDNAQTPIADFTDKVALDGAQLAVATSCTP